MRRLLPLLLLLAACGDTIVNPPLTPITDDGSARACSIIVNIGSVSGSGNTVIVDASACVDATGGDVTGGVLQFACAPEGDSAVTCTWADGLAHELVAENPAYGAKSMVCASPCTIDPEISATEPREHSMTLRSQDNVVIAGPIPVTTQS